MAVADRRPVEKEEGYALHEERAGAEAGLHGKERRTSGAATAAGDTGKSRTGSVARSDGVPSNAEVRSWARENGLTISDRRRVPASVMAAYRSAHNK